MNTYEIEGKPIPLQRARMVGKRCFDPQTKEKAEACIKLRSQIQSVLKAVNGIKLTIEYHMPIPRSYSLKRAMECVFKPHTKKPDLSNLIKFTEDAFNGVVWEDDALICEIAAKKFYSPEAKTVFWVEPLTV